MTITLKEITLDRAIAFVKRVRDLCFLVPYREGEGIPLFGAIEDNEYLTAVLSKLNDLERAIMLLSRLMYATSRDEGIEKRDKEILDLIKESLVTDFYGSLRDLDIAFFRPNWGTDGHLETFLFVRYQSEDGVETSPPDGLTRIVSMGGKLVSKGMHMLFEGSDIALATLGFMGHPSSLVVTAFFNTPLPGDESFTRYWAPDS